MAKGDELMPIRYKFEVLSALKEHGFTTYRIRKEKLLSESTVQKLRKQEPLAWENIETLCRLLDCQPSDILEYVKEGDAPHAEGKGNPASHA